MSIPEKILQAGCDAYAATFLNGNGSLGDGIEAAYLAIHLHDEWVHSGPPAWSGEDPPPVGTVCAVLNSDLGSPTWERCTILYSGKHRVIYDSDSCEERVAFIEDLKFRPARTPEQIAAEEREDEVNRMVATASILDKGWARKVCGALYDAGYRKFEIVDGEA